MAQLFHTLTEQNNFYNQYGWVMSVIGEICAEGEARDESEGTQTFRRTQWLVGEATVYVLEHPGEFEKFIGESKEKKIIDSKRSLFRLFIHIFHFILLRTAKYFLSNIDFIID